MGAIGIRYGCGMIVNHKHKFIFLKTWKTGGTSVELALRNLCGDGDIITRLTEDDSSAAGRAPQNYLHPRSDWPVLKRVRWRLGWRPSARRKDLLAIGYFGHTAAGEIRRRLGEDIWSSYFKFTVERNPWDREVSHYYWQTRNQRSPSSFLDFVRSGPRLDNWSIYTIDDEIIANHVIRYENLEAGLGEALGKIGLVAPPLPHAKGNNRPQNTRGYKQYYNKETQEIIRSSYKREVDFFEWTY